MPAGSHPHDVAPAADGGIWFTAQAAGYLGWLDPRPATSARLPWGRTPRRTASSWPGRRAVGHRRRPERHRARGPADERRPAISRYSGRNANLNTAAFDRNGILWFTGQDGVYGRLDPSSAELNVFDAPRGAGPYGIIATPDGSRVFYASLAGSHIAEINLETGQATPIDLPTPGQGARRVWTDSHGSIWVSEWNAGQVARYDPRSGDWREWKLPGGRPSAYAVWVDQQDTVWLSDWGSNAIVSFDPTTETFQQFVMPQSGSDIRELQGRPGEVWGAESGQDRIVVIRHLDAAILARMR